MKVSASSAQSFPMNHPQPSLRVFARAIISVAFVAASAGCAGVDPGGAAKPASLFFDDFSYALPAELASGGWQVRDGVGHPGLPGGRFGAEAVTLSDDPLQAGNRVLRMTARTDGTGPNTVQAQVCHQRKYLRGTYAARIRFSDVPRAGIDGDPIIQSFYAVAPLAHAFDPDFSELDWEYLPNGGWGSDKTRLYGVSWQTVQIDPWESHNSAHEEFGSFDGWHTLLMQVTKNAVHEFVDGREVAVHDGRNVPVSPMTISFNLWFAVGGKLPTGGAARVYDEDIDWVFHARDQVLSPAEVDNRIRALRADHVTHTDTVPAADPPLQQRCDI
jgi:hypothetical protein